jgi:LmbE family N-acetylglucosaminyl deacetylase
MKRTWIGLLLAFVVPELFATHPPVVLDSAEMRVAVDRLGNSGSVLYVAAHPDDENTALLSYLSTERGYRTAYLSVTRGDGGQNLIGDEKGDYLGVIRTQELLAARRIDGAEQFFTRAVDFGYSKSAEETFAKWGRDQVLSDVVWIVRKFRPDVIITRFPTTGEGGHGQHTASAILALEAFAAAADPGRFPEQLRLVEPWQPKRIFWNVFRFNPNEPVPDDSLRLDIGAYNEVLGRSYTEIAGQSRSMHKSQGFGAPERRGTLLNYFKQLAGEPATSDIFDGIDTGWARFPRGEAVQKMVDAIKAGFDFERPEAIVPELMELHARLDIMRDTPIVERRKLETRRLIRSAAGIWTEAIADRATATPGEEIKVATMIVNRSSIPIDLVAVEAAPGGGAVRERKTLASNAPVREELKVPIPEGHPSTQPYWLRAPRSEGLHDVRSQDERGLPEEDAPFRVRFHVRIGADLVTFEEPIIFRYTDRVRGEVHEPLVISPKVAVELSRPLILFTDAKPRKLRVDVRLLSPSPVADGAVSVTEEEGWKVVPSSSNVKLGESRTVSTEFTITPPGKATSEGTLRAQMRSGDATFDQGIATIEYEHLPRQTLFPAAVLSVVRLDLRRAGDRIGYVMGAGDEIPAILREAGYDVELVSDAQIAAGDYSGYDAVVVGVRAFNSRDALKRNAESLFAFAEKGGTVVVQYNTNDDTMAKGVSPIPLKISRDRVTLEDSPVQFDSSHPLMSSPNKITQADFEGWVQERGLYFPGEWDAKFSAPLTMSDPGEAPKKGALLYARHGRGVFIYTGLSFFRQLPAAVPGAIRLFANLVAKR